MIFKEIIEKAKDSTNIVFIDASSFITKYTTIETILKILSKEKEIYFFKKNKLYLKKKEKETINESTDLSTCLNSIIIYDYENCRGMDLILNDNLYIVITIWND